MFGFGLLKKPKEASDGPEEIELKDVQSIYEQFKKNIIFKMNIYFTSPVTADKMEAT